MTGAKPQLAGIISPQFSSNPSLGKERRREGGGLARLHGVIASILSYSHLCFSHTVFKIKDAVQSGDGGTFVGRSTVFSFLFLPRSPRVVHMGDLLEQLEEPAPPPPNAWHGAAASYEASVAHAEHEVPHIESLLLFLLVTCEMNTSTVSSNISVHPHGGSACQGRAAAEGWLMSRPPATTTVNYRAWVETIFLIVSSTLVAKKKKKGANTVHHLPDDSPPRGKLTTRTYRLARGRESAAFTLINLPVFLFQLYQSNLSEDTQHWSVNTAYYRVENTERGISPNNWSFS